MSDFPNPCSRQHGNNMTSSQDNFYALQLLGFQGQRVTKSTATKSKLNTLRHFSEDLRTVQDEGHQHEWPPLLGVMHRRGPCTNLATFRTRADVPLPVRSDVPQCRHSRESLRESHVVSKPNFGWQLWRRNGYICVYFYWPPGPNPVVTISTRVGPGSRLPEYRTIIRGCHRNRLGDSTAWVRELWPRSIAASICLLDCRLAKIGNPGRRQGSAASTSEALVRRKGWFSKRGYAGRVQALKAAAKRKHDQRTAKAIRGRRRCPSTWEQRIWRRRGTVSVL